MFNVTIPIVNSYMRSSVQDYEHNHIQADRTVHLETDYTPMFVA